MDRISRLVLVRVKTEWAKKHLRNLETESRNVRETAVLIQDEKAGIHAHPIGILWCDVPMVSTISFDAVCMAGDVIHNLRSALDHLAQHLALVYTPTLSEKELRGVEFPIAETFTKYEADKARKVKGINPLAVKDIDRLKPYGDGDGEFSRLLWRLHALDNVDKHRTLFTIGPEFIFTSSWFPGTFHTKTDDPNFGGLVTNVEKDFQSEISEAVNKAKIGQAQALLPSLKELIEMVDGVIWGLQPFLE